MNCGRNRECSGEETQEREKMTRACLKLWKAVRKECPKADCREKERCTEPSEDQREAYGVYSCGHWVSRNDSSEDEAIRNPYRDGQGGTEEEPDEQR